MMERLREGDPEKEKLRNERTLQATTELREC